MKLVSFIPCERILSEGGEGLTIVGFFRRYSANSLPSKYSFYVMIEVEEFDLEAYNSIVVEMIAPLSKDVVAKVVTERFPLEGRNLDEGNLVANLTIGIDIRNIEFAVAGDYKFQVKAVRLNEDDDVIEEEVFGSSRIEVEVDEDVSESNKAR